jgi:hypothetical protein
MNTLGWVLTLLCALPRLRWRSFEYVEDFSITTILEISLMYMLSHRSTLYCFVAMFLSYRISTVYSFVDSIKSCRGGMHPHCISGGHILIQYFHGSVAYLLAAML